MSPKTEGFSLPSNGSSQTLFVAVPLTATATGGTTQGAEDLSPIPLFAALTVHGNTSHLPTSASRPLFIIGQPHRPKPKCLRRRSAATQPTKLPQKGDGVEKSSPTEVAAKVEKLNEGETEVDKAATLTTGVSGYQSYLSSLSMESQVRAQAPKVPCGDKSTIAPVTSSNSASPSGCQSAKPNTNNSTGLPLFPCFSAPAVVKTPVRLFSFNPNRHKLNSGSSLGKAHSIDFLARPTSSPISRSNSNGSASSSFSFKPNAVGAFANASAVSVSSFCFKPHAIVSIGSEPKDPPSPAPIVASGDPKSSFSTFSFKPNAMGTFGDPSVKVEHKGGIACKSGIGSRNLTDSVSPFSFKPSASASFGNTSTFNFVYSPTPADNGAALNKAPTFAFNAKASSFNTGCLFGKPLGFARNENGTRTGFSFNPSATAGRSGGVVQASAPAPSSFSFGSADNRSFHQYPFSSDQAPRRIKKTLRQSSTGFLFSPSNVQTTNSLGVTTSKSLFNIGSASTHQPVKFNSPCTNATVITEPRGENNPDAASSQTLQCFSFGNAQTSSQNLPPSTAANPFVIQIQNISSTNPQTAGNPAEQSRIVSVSQTDGSKPCVSITNNNLVIQITNDSVQVIINSINNS